MGSASKQALVAAQAALKAAGSKATLGVAEELFAADRALAASAQLRATLADPAIAPKAKDELIKKVFGRKLSATSAGLLGKIVAQRWSNQDDLLAGIEDVAIRAAAKAAGAKADVVAEIFAFARAVASDADLELALGSKLGEPEAKAKVVVKLIGKKADKSTVAIISALVQQPRGRRIGKLLAQAAATVAESKGAVVATVTSAAPLAAAQASALSKSVGGLYGADVIINSVIDENVVGGLRVQVGDDIIDGSVATRLHDLRLALVG